MPLNFEFLEEEILREFEDYKNRLLESESRNSALCEAYHSMAVSWHDVLQEIEEPFDSERAQNEADYIKEKIKHYEKISDRYCDKEWWNFLTPAYLA